MTGPIPKDWQDDEPDLYKRYIASCFSILGVEIPSDISLGGDIVAHWATIGTVASYRDWRKSRFDVMEKWAHDLG